MMLSLLFATLAVAIITATTNALPASVSSSIQSRAAIEIWNIPRMELHMMTRHSGLPGDGGWPESKKYPSSIDFDVNMPNNQSAHCQNTFTNGTLPEDTGACTSEGGRVRFQMIEYTALGPRRKELSFVLQVFKLEGTSEQQNVTTGEIAITANSPAEPTSYLTCLLGAPFDGLRCKLHGMMSNRKELEIVARTPTQANADDLFTAS
ncbi:hypothetical protein OPT61_g4611 [Boeremia exigua]|uniref:Uncharacterized protein n=1 Tax=Boeremia exigua TaxID=749465 RepID=A0ACC2IDI8_9PLEO|nr:hypothetical protein OPT61_g4611 [Boeremia exigua]